LARLNVLVELALPGETRVLQVFPFQPGSLIIFPPPPVTRALGVIGLAAGPVKKEVINENKVH